MHNCVRNCAGVKYPGTSHLPEAREGGAVRERKPKNVQAQFEGSGGSVHTSVLLMRPRAARSLSAARAAAGVPWTKHAGIVPSGSLVDARSSSSKVQKLFSKPAFGHPQCCVMQSEAAFWSNTPGGRASSWSSPWFPPYSTCPR
eukprot:4529070-Prymnesium_polylepis.1